MSYSHVCYLLSVRQIQIHYFIVIDRCLSKWEILFKYFMMASNNNHKVTKRKKIITELKADNIDSTAPVKKIVDELQHKNEQAYRFYYHNLSQRRTTKSNMQNYHYVVPGHPLNAFSDDWDGQLNMEYFEVFPYKSFPPKMITVLNNLDKADPVTIYMKTKMQWQHTLQSLKLSASFTNMNQKYKIFNDDVVQCPKHVIDMAAHLDSHPDPYFDSTYNWYYAGNGNLQLICIDWVDYLLYSEFNCAYLSQFNRGDTLIKKEPTAKFECEIDDNILETICLNNIVTLRTRNVIYILKLFTLDDEIMFEKLKVIQSDLPYTSISYDNHHKNILYVTTLDYKVSIVNLDRMKARTVKLNAKLTSLVDNWNTVIGSGRETFTHVTKKSISMYDKRTNISIHEWNGLRHITDEVSCNDISLARHFEGTSSLYFATDHHLFLMDIRFNSNQKAAVIQRWIHGMEVVPTYLSYCNFEFSKDLICLSSQWCEDMCVIPNYNDRIVKEPESGGLTIPYRPPSILNALHEARQRMLCYDLYNPIDSRLCTAITGNLVIEQGDKYGVLMQNSLGDLSLHTIFPEHLETFVEDDSAQCLNDWCQNYKVEKKIFEVTSVVNIAKILRQLKKVPSDYKIEGGWVKKYSKFNENEINDVFDKEEIDSGLQEVWVKGCEVPTMEQSSLALNLYYSDDEKPLS